MEYIGEIKSKTNNKQRKSIKIIKAVDVELADIETKIKTNKQRIINNQKKAIRIRRIVKRNKN